MATLCVPRYSEFDKSAGKAPVALEMDCGETDDGALALRSTVRLPHYLCGRGLPTSAKRCVPLREEIVFFIAGAAIRQLTACSSSSRIDQQGRAI